MYLCTILGTTYSHVGNEMFPRWEQNIPKYGIPTLGTKHSQVWDFLRALMNDCLANKPDLFCN